MGGTAVLSHEDAPDAVITNKTFCEQTTSALGLRTLPCNQTSVMHIRSKGKIQPSDKCVTG